MSSRAFRGLRFPSIAIPLLVAASSCASKDASAPPTDGGSTLQPITIGVVLSLTGDLSSPGQVENAATKVALAQINALGGVLGRPVDFKIVDDASDKAIAI